MHLSADAIDASASLGYLPAFGRPRRSTVTGAPLHTMPTYLTKWLSRDELEPHDG